MGDISGQSTGKRSPCMQCIHHSGTSCNFLLSTLKNAIELNWGKQSQKIWIFIWILWLRAIISKFFFLNLRQLVYFDKWSSRCCERASCSPWLCCIASSRCRPNRDSRPSRMRRRRCQCRWCSSPAGILSEIRMKMGNLMIFGPKYGPRRYWNLPGLQHTITETLRSDKQIIMKLLALAGGGVGIILVPLKKETIFLGAYPFSYSGSIWSRCWLLRHSILWWSGNNLGRQVSRASSTPHCRLSTCCFGTQRKS